MRRGSQGLRWHAPGPRWSMWISAAMICAAVLSPATSMAADDIEISLKGVVAKGKTPSLTLLIHKAVASLSVTLSCDGPERLSLHKKALRRGVRLRVPLRHALGERHWSGKLGVRFRDGDDGELPLNFVSSNRGALSLKSHATREGLLAGHLGFEVDRPLAHVWLKVLGEQGRVLLEQDSATEAGGVQQLNFTPPPKSEGEIVEISLKLEDLVGWTNGIEFFPWQVNIPHKELVFESGKSELRQAELPKLDAVLGRLRALVRRFGSTGNAKLWIAGHTDTVGQPGANQILSEARALAIARYFRSKGIVLPIAYRGFGELALAVPTADEVDELRNRRAEYVLAAEDPYAAENQQALPRRWRTLP